MVIAKGLQKEGSPSRELPGLLRLEDIMSGLWAFPQHALRAALQQPLVAASELLLPLLQVGL